jgi:hypothetical protein
MLAWRIYYSDGSTFSSDQGEPQDAPPTGVICIRERNASAGSVTRSGKDFYIWNAEAGQWWQSDAVGFWQYMFEPGPKVVKFGVNTSDENYNWIMGTAANDPNFTKTGKHVLEV